MASSERCGPCALFERRADPDAADFVGAATGACWGGDLVLSFRTADGDTVALRLTTADARVLAREVDRAGGVTGDA